MANKRSLKKFINNTSRELAFDTFIADCALSNPDEAKFEAITLILLALLGKLFDHDQTVYVSVTAFTCVSALFDLIKTLPGNVRSALGLEGVLGFAERILPWFRLNLGWVVPSLIGLALGLLIRWVRIRGNRG